MCKTHNPRKIDKCMRRLIANLNIYLEVDVLACCCGHGKYPQTILVKDYKERRKSEISDMIIFDLCSDIVIPRKKKFYKKDKEGYYFIPECIK